MLNNIAEKLSQARQRKVLADINQSEDVKLFMELYDEYMVRPEGDDRATETDGFHPSHLGIKYGNCMRRAVYLLRGERKESNFSPRVKRIFGNGHAVHNRLQDVFGHIAEFESEVTVKWDGPDGIPVRGHADGILILPWNGRRVLIEIKSCSQTVYDNRLKFQKAKADHFDQANIYAYILETDVIWFIYENKNTQEYIIFEQATDKGMAEKQIKKWTKAWNIFNRGELPVKPYKIESEACQSCDMFKLCQADETVGVKL